MTGNTPLALAEARLAAAGIRTVETDERVPGIRPALRTRFAWRALRRARKLNAARLFPSYRHEVVHEGGRWAVVVMQNRAVGP